MKKNTEIFITILVTFFALYGIASWIEDITNYFQKNDSTPWIVTLPNQGPTRPSILLKKNGVWKWVEEKDIKGF